MSFSLPNPTTPTNGTPGDATPILQNELALAQAVNNFDGSQINAKSVTEGALADTVNPRLRESETGAGFVYSGCIWSLVSGFSGTMTGGTIYVNGYRVIVSAIGANTFAATSDTYVDVDYLGNVTYNAVSNGATAPAITANAIRIAKIVTSGSTITSIVQSGSDGQGHLIYPIGDVSTANIQNPYKMSAYLNAAQNSTNGTSLINLDTVLFDTGNNFSTSTHLITIPVTGFYFFSFGIQSSGAFTSIWQANIKKNASSIICDGSLFSGSAFQLSNGSGIFQFNAGDTLGLYIQATGVVAINNSFVGTYLNGFMVSRT